MKTIFISAYNPFISRNILNTDVLNGLRKRPNLRIVILAPANKTEFLKKYYEGENVVVEGVDAESVYRSASNKFWYRLAFLLQNSQYVRDQRGERLWRNRNILGYLNYFWVSLWSAILSRIPLTRKAYRFFDYKFSSKSFFSEYFQKYSSSLVFSTDIFGETDILLLREAKSRKILSVGMVRSWDNPTTKGILRLIPDKIIVNGLVAKEELINFHDCKEKDILVAGLPQFDNWLSGPTISREDFFKKIGADPAKRLILFAPAGSILSDTDWQLCQILKDAINNGSLPDNIQFLVRNHPHHPADFSQFGEDPRFIFEVPGARNNIQEVKLSETGSSDKNDRLRNYAEFNPDDNDHLRNSVYYSDIVMYVATSLGLDAAVYDKPQIMISFDGWEKRPYVRSVRRFNREDCLANLVKLGGTSVVTGKEDWIKLVNQYLKDPTLDGNGRKKIIERQMYKLDGKAGQRIAEAIIELL